MAETIYFLCSLASIACALLLFRANRATGIPLLFWSAICFMGLAANNVLVFVDLIVVPAIDLRPWRSGAALFGLTMLIFEMIRESR